MCDSCRGHICLTSKKLAGNPGILMLLYNYSNKVEFSSGSVLSDGCNLFLFSFIICSWIVFLMNACIIWTSMSSLLKNVSNSEQSMNYPLWQVCYSLAIVYKWPAKSHDIFFLSLSRFWKCFKQENSTQWTANASLNPLFFKKNQKYTITGEKYEEQSSLPARNVGYREKQSVKDKWRKHMSHLGRLWSEV